MLSLAVITARLQAEMPQLRLVAGAAALAAAKDQLTALPAAYVLPGSETAQRNPLLDASQHSQVSTEQVTVILAARNVRDARGAAAHAELLALSQALRAALVGWAPDDARGALNFVRAGPLELGDAVLFWPETYDTLTLITKP